ncbi:MAG: hypothetical protein ACOYEV_19775, partial [Candidatus Nanopelagicales bacterium]
MVGRTGVRIGTAAFALGLSLAGPHSTGLATADDGSGENSTVSAGPSGEAAPSATSASRREQRAGRVPAPAPRLGPVTAAPRTGASVRPVTGSRAAAGVAPVPGSPASPGRPIAAVSAVADPPTVEVRIPATRYGRNTLALSTVHAFASPLAAAALVPTGDAGVRGVQPAAIRSAPILEQLNTA